MRALTICCMVAALYAGCGRGAGHVVHRARGPAVLHAGGHTERLGASATRVELARRRGEWLLAVGDKATRRFARRPAVRIAGGRVTDRLTGRGTVRLLGARLLAKDVHPGWLPVGLGRSAGWMRGMPAAALWRFTGNSIARALRHGGAGRSRPRCGCADPSPRTRTTSASCTKVDHDDRDAVSRLPCRLAPGDFDRHDDIDARAHQLLGEIGPIEIVSAGEPGLQHEILTLHVAAVSQCLPDLLDTEGIVNDRGKQRATRYTFPACCASAASGTAMRPSSRTTMRSRGPAM